MACPHLPFGGPFSRTRSFAHTRRGPRQVQVARTAINTTIAATTGGVAACAVSFLHRRRFVAEIVAMGILSGLVSSTAAGPYVPTPLIIPVAAIGFGVYYAAALALRRLEIDDPVHAFPVHGACGFWGLVAAGLFRLPEMSPHAKGYGQQLWLQVRAGVLWLGLGVLCFWMCDCRSVVLSFAFGHCMFSLLCGMS